MSRRDLVLLFFPSKAWPKWIVGCWLKLAFCYLRMTDIRENIVLSMCYVLSSISLLYIYIIIVWFYAVVFAHFHEVCQISEVVCRLNSKYKLLTRCGHIGTWDILLSNVLEAAQPLVLSPNFFSSPQIPKLVSWNMGAGQWFVESADLGAIRFVCSWCEACLCVHLRFCFTSLFEVWQNTVHSWTTQQFDLS